MSSAGDAETRALRRVGTTLVGKWTIERLLGVGGMAAVYAARHRNAHTAALKILHRELSFDEGLRSRFLREGYAANTVGHPGAVRVLDDDVAEDGSVFLVMELLEGETVDARAARSPGGVLSLGEVLWIADGVLDVLVAAHAKGIVHRDIKPENLFVAKDRAIKILDFGIARIREAAAASATQTGMTIGTPAFMAPEQALGKSQLIGAPADLWSVGATMFYLLTGRYVHDGESANEVLVRAATQQAPSVGVVAPTVPAEVAALVDRALAFEIADRWRDADELQAAVRRIAGRASKADLASAVEPVADDAEPKRAGSQTELAAPSDGGLHLPPPLIPDLPARPTAAVTDLSAVRTSAADGVRRPWMPLAAGGAVLLALGGLWTLRPGSSPPHAATAPPSSAQTLASGLELASSAVPTAPSASSPLGGPFPTLSPATTAALPAVGIDALPAVVPAAASARKGPPLVGNAAPPVSREAVAPPKPPRTAAPASVFDRQD